MSNILLKSEATHDKVQDNSSESKNPKLENSHVEGFYVELPITKEVPVNNSISVSIRKSYETAKNLLCLETDITGDVLLHWGVCRDDLRRWEVPPAPHPPQTVAFKDRALRTQLQVGIWQVACFLFFYILSLFRLLNVFLYYTTASLVMFLYLN